jgi:hypothetical protein
MPNPRVLFDPDELVISKTTKDATDPDLPETDKILDSKWLFGLQVLGSGVWTYPLEVSTYRDFTLPDYGFRPALMIRTKCRPYYSGNNYRDYTDRPALSVFSGCEHSWEAGTTNPDWDRFINDTTVRIYRTDGYSHIEFHWLAIAL